MLIRSKEKIPELGRIKKENPYINQATFGLRLRSGGPTMYLTGEILLQPRVNSTINDILALIENQYDSFEPRGYNTYKVSVKDWNKIIDLANKIFESGLVNYCHPNFIAPIKKHQVITPTDNLYPDQYHLNQANNIDINAPQAWGLSRGLNPVRVAVIDDGIEAHEDINGRVVPGFTPTDPNGQGAPVNPAPPANLQIIGHGQACAGIIGATHDNVGIAGVFPCAEIVPVNIFNDWIGIFDQFGNMIDIDWNEDALDIRDAIDWAWDQGEADVLSNSWGYGTANPQDIDPNAPGFIPNFDDIIFAINRARTQGRGGLGSIVVFASGNNHPRSGFLGFNGVSFPADVNGVLTVGAIDRNGSITDYSSRGAEMDLVAPSGGSTGDVVTIDRMGNPGYNNGNYTTTFGGTSAACPQVSGVAALMLSVNPTLTEAAVRTTLQSTATDMGATGFDNTYGFGRLNAQAAIQQVLPSIAGSDIMCASSTFSVQGVPAGTDVNWTATPAYLFGTDTGTGLNFTTLPTSSSTSGIGTITAIIAGDCQNLVLNRTVQVGPPGPGSISGNSSICLTQANYYTVPYNQFNTNYVWSVRTSTGGVVPRGSFTIQQQPATGTIGSKIKLLANVTGYYRLYCVISTGCNKTHTIYKYITVNIPGTAGCDGMPEKVETTSTFSVYPVPSDDFLEISYNPNEYEADNIDDKSNSDQTAPSFEIELYNNQQKRVKHLLTKYETKIKIDISDLPSGLYYLHIITASGTEQRQVLIE